MLFLQGILNLLPETETLPSHLPGNDIKSIQESSGTFFLGLLEAAIHNVSRIRKLVFMNQTKLVILALEVWWTFSINRKLACSWSWTCNVCVGNQAVCLRSQSDATSKFETFKMLQSHAQSPKIQPTIKFKDPSKQHVSEKISSERGLRTQKSSDIIPLGVIFCCWNFCHFCVSKTCWSLDVAVLRWLKVKLFFLIIQTTSKNTSFWIKTCYTVLWRE